MNADMDIIMQVAIYDWPHQYSVYIASKEAHCRTIDDINAFRQVLETGEDARIGHSFAKPC